MRGSVRLIAAAMLVSTCLSLRCDRTPDVNYTPKSPYDGRYEIKISGNPTKYVPGTAYTVSLVGTEYKSIQNKFQKFLLAAEPTSLEDNVSPHAVGTFQIMGDTLTQFSERCPNAVQETNSLPKSNVEVMWIAPSTGSGCVSIRATVVEQSRGQWYMDDGLLTRVLCEDMQESDDLQPTIVNPCCACDEAKYEVTFEGLWSRHTHPKDFPSNGWLTRFSDVIGASHTFNYRFWEYGKYASEGLRAVAELGSTRMLESELKAKSDNIRTIIKARGISYPNVTGKTFAVFRVDNRNHLVSLVSMIDPSPDWIVGVSGFELCLPNCSWVESKTFNLYPWDAGTDSGPTYISPDYPTNPPEPIRKIKVDRITDRRSPFYSEIGEEMKPFARLYLSRQRLYEKSCDPTMFIPIEEEENDNSGNCAVGEWQEWSPCSVTCGKNGIKHRQRFYVNRHQAETMGCTKQLTMRMRCVGAQRYCHGGGHHHHGDDSGHADPACELSEWSEWSSCSNRCGKGTRTRFRKYSHRPLLKSCRAGSMNPPPLEQNDECYGSDTDCNDNEVYEKEGCEMSPWSSWSPCLTVCGKANQIRTRYPVTDGGFYGDSQYREIASEMDLCEGVKMIEEVDCEVNIPNCNIDENEAKRICSLPKKEGDCNRYQARWFFNSNASPVVCDRFNYTGCNGNENNFDTAENCLQACKTLMEDSITTTSERFGGLQSRDQTKTGDGSLVGYNNGVTVGSPHPVVDCLVSGWSDWTECNSTCAPAFRQRVRDILRYPMNGGKACPTKLFKSRRCKELPPCNSDNERTAQHPLEPTWGPSNRPNRIRIDCRMSEWSTWSPCSATCGLHAIEQRTRNVLVYPKGGGAPCEHRLEQRSCNKLPCPIGAYRL